MARGFWPNLFSMLFVQTMCAWGFGYLPGQSWVHDHGVMIIWLIMCAWANGWVHRGRQSPIANRP